MYNHHLQKIRCIFENMLEHLINLLLIQTFHFLLMAVIFLSKNLYKYLSESASRTRVKNEDDKWSFKHHKIKTG